MCFRCEGEKGAFCIVISTSVSVQVFLQGRVEVKAFCEWIGGERRLDQVVQYDPQSLAFLGSLLLIWYKEASGVFPFIFEVD